MANKKSLPSHCWDEKLCSFRGTTRIRAILPRKTGTAPLRARVRRRYASIRRDRCSAPLTGGSRRTLRRSAARAAAHRTIRRGRQRRISPSRLAAAVVLPAYFFCIAALLGTSCIRHSQYSDAIQRMSRQPVGWADLAHLLRMLRNRERRADPCVCAVILMCMAVLWAIHYTGAACGDPETMSMLRSTAQRSTSLW